MTWLDIFYSNITASQRVSSLVAKAILAIMVRGTESNMPMGPNTQPQKIKEIMTTRGDNPNLRADNSRIQKIPDDDINGQISQQRQQGGGEDPTAPGPTKLPESPR